MPAQRRYASVEQGRAEGEEEAAASQAAGIGRQIGQGKGHRPILSAAPHPAPSAGDTVSVQYAW